MKHFNFWALALTAIIVASCTSEDDLTLSPPANQANEETETPIMFTSSQSAFTRADFKGAEAAAKLGNKFVVTGFKGDETKTPGNIVFDNYLVQYQENTANTTESNSSNWEYVGKGLIPHAVTNGIVAQTIKYWDYTVAQYDFLAWAMGKVGDEEITAIYNDDPLSGHQVRVSAIAPNNKTTNHGWPDDKTVDAKTYKRPAYTFEGAAVDLAQCYISDIVTVNKTGTPAGIYGEVSGYNQPVTLKFRQLGTKVRIAIYETVPGYSVRNVEFYTAANVDLIAANKANGQLFTTEANQIYTEGKYTVYFPTVDDANNADNNQAHIIFEPSASAQSTIVDWGTMNYTDAEKGEKTEGKVFLGRTSNTASFAGEASKNYYEFFLPNEVGTNLNLRVDYTLEAIDGGGEAIKVRGATAQVPSIYTQWKPGYAYTYVFKISDKTNGYTGIYDPTKPDDATVESGPAGLYPITFDAVVVDAEEGNNNQETITLVSTPSITTYQKGSNVINANEYTVLTANATDKINGIIYVTVNDGEGYEEVPAANIEAGVTNVENYYTYNGSTHEYTECNAGAIAAGNTTYYMKKTILETGDLQDLYGKAALYVLPALPTGRTAPWSEAEVIDALQYQDENDGSAPAGTITGRSGLVLTPATAPNALALGNTVEYGVDGNEITIPATGDEKKAAYFTPAASTNYAFVYTKTAPNGAQASVKKYQPVNKTVNQPVGANVYRYALTAAPTAPSSDVQKGVTYFAKNDGSEGSITAFLGQTVSNLYLDAAGTQQASGYAKSNVTYYYTANNGLTYEAAHAVAYADFANTTLYKELACTNAFTAEEKAGGPVDGTEYYWKDSNDKRYYCVIMPQQTTNLYVINKDEAQVVGPLTATDNAVTGIIYLDQYIYNNGVRYAKIIKIAAN